MRWLEQVLQMAIGAFIPLVFFIVILATVGVRLVALWRRTRQVPELSLGAGLLVVACAMPLTGIGRAPALAMEPIGRTCFAAGLCAIAFGLSLLGFFNYRVFRRDSRWGRALFALMSASFFGAAIYMSAANFQGENVTAIKAAMRPGTFTIMGTILACFLWGGAESLGQRAAQQRRLALGLGDPVVANRFLLWGIASVTCSALMVVLVVCVHAGMTIPREPFPLVTIGGAGTIMSATWYLTFFAPPSYQQSIRARAARAR